jgi:enoyl-CoA hydratase
VNQEHHDVAVRRDGRAVHVVLNRPSRLNALSHEMVISMRAALAEAIEEPDVDVVLLRAVGARAFSAGGDLVFLHQDSVAGSGQALAYWADLYGLVADIAQSPTRVVSLMDGLVLGGGLGVAGRCHERVVTQHTVLGMPETRIGFFPDTGGLHLLSHLAGEVGTYLGLCAATVNGSDALAVGLAEHFVLSDDVQLIVDRAGVTAWDDLIARYRAPAPQVPTLPAAWVEECFAGADVRAIIERLVRHSDPDAQAAGALLKTRSPSAVSVTLRGLRVARDLTLDDELAMELRMAAHLKDSHDFRKDRDPVWSPASPGDVCATWLDEVVS